MTTESIILLVLCFAFVVQGCIFAYLVHVGMTDYKRMSLELLLVVQVLSENIMTAKDEIVTTKKFVAEMREHGWLDR